MEASAAPTRKPSKRRSPSYPAINLETALDRAEQLEVATGRHPAPVEAAMSTWGYSAKSSGGLLAIAALKKYGLLEDGGRRDARKVWLTSLGRELIAYGEDRTSDEWLKRARKAALTPTIFGELWEQYDGTLPTDGVMLPDLRIERGFTENAARDMLKRFRETIAFARLSEAGATVSENGEDNGSDPDEHGDDEIVTPATIEQPTGAKPKGRSQQEPRTIQVTYSPTAWALVQGAFPMTEDDWESFIAVLQGMKRGLVTRDEQA